MSQTQTDTQTVERAVFCLSRILNKPVQAPCWVGKQIGGEVLDKVAKIMCISMRSLWLEKFPKYTTTKILTSDNLLAVNRPNQPLRLCVSYPFV